MIKVHLLTIKKALSCCFISRWNPNITSYIFQEINNIICYSQCDTKCFSCMYHLAVFHLNFLKLLGYENNDRNCNKSEMSLSCQILQQEISERKTEHLLCISLKNRPSSCHQGDTAPFHFWPQWGKREVATVVSFFRYFSIILTCFDSGSNWLFGLSVCHSQANGFLHVTCTVNNSMYWGFSLRKYCVKLK